MNPFQKAAEDFRYLLNRGYPRKSALGWVGNRYGLNFDERHLLHRGVFTNKDSKSRREKITSPKELKAKDLAIDGHNVLITIEAGLLGRPLILGDDGFIRDISGLSGRFRESEVTRKAIGLMIDVIKILKPRQTLFLFDAPMSRSGELAQEVRNSLNREGLPGDAVAVKVPEKILIDFDGMIATSDTVLIDQVPKVFDLAGHILKERIGLGLTLQFLPTRKKRPK